MKPTEQFKTKTVLKKRQNVKPDGVWPVALDVGYSSVKGYSPNMVYCFPSFAKKSENEETLFGNPGVYDIKYRDEKGEVWNVGYLAQDMVDIDDTNDSSKLLYGRARYHNPMFLVITRVGLALGMVNNEFGTRSPGDKIVVQAGLPPKYKKNDTANVVKVTSGHHVFDIKVGNNDWMHFDFVIEPENVLVMAQPMGALWSIACDNDGKFVKDAVKYFNSKVLILDPGFGTVDWFTIMNRNTQGYETFDDLGMKRILEKTVNYINNMYGEEISIVKMQSVLKTGTFNYVDTDTMSQEVVDITDILNRYNEEVCQEALDRGKQLYNFFKEFNYLVVSGGTGAAWMEHIQDHLKNMTALTVLPAIVNDTLPNMFANVRGYYMYLVASIRSRK